MVAIFQSFVSTEAVHPYHVGSVEINYNAKSTTFEVTGRFFLDDLENGLGKNMVQHFILMIRNIK